MDRERILKFFGLVICALMLHFVYVFTSNLQSVFLVFIVIICLFLVSLDFGLQVGRITKGTLVVFVVVMFSFGFVAGNSFNLYILDLSGTDELPSPADRIETRDVSEVGGVVCVDTHFESDRLHFNGDFADTNSMEPFLDVDSTTLVYLPYRAEEIRVGDIVSFRQDNESYIIHMVKKVGYDDDGWFAITKGYNVPNNDGLKVRFENITGVVFGILY